MALIQVQDRYGAWHNFQNVSDSPYSIVLGMQTALKQSQIAIKARAVDKQGHLLDILIP